MRISVLVFGLGDVALTEGLLLCLNTCSVWMCLVINSMCWGVWGVSMVFEC
jgi:hypothetical protein